MAVAGEFASLRIAENSRFKIQFTATGLVAVDSVAGPWVRILGVKSYRLPWIVIIRPFRITDRISYFSLRSLLRSF